MVNDIAFLCAIALLRIVHCMILSVEKTRYKNTENLNDYRVSVIVSAFLGHLFAGGGETHFRIAAWMWLAESCFASTSNERLSANFRITSYRPSSNWAPRTTCFFIVTWHFQSDHKTIDSEMALNSTTKTYTINTSYNLQAAHARTTPCQTWLPYAPALTTALRAHCSQWISFTGIALVTPILCLGGSLSLGGRGPNDILARHESTKCWKDGGGQPDTARCHAV